MKLLIAFIFSISAFTSLVVHAEDGSKRLHELHLKNQQRAAADAAPQELN